MVDSDFLLENSIYILNFFHEVFYLKKQTFYFRIVLGLQKSCKDSFYLPHRHSCLLLTSYISAVRVLEQMS